MTSRIIPKIEVVPIIVWDNMATRLLFQIKNGTTSILGAQQPKQINFVSEKRRKFLQLNKDSVN